MRDASVVGSSFRDPGGNVVTRNGEIFRKINHSYKKEYEYLLRSGLYKKLVALKFLIPHQEIPAKLSSTYKIIKPVQIPFISYPYEWSFSQLKDAALLTLRIQKIALEYNMTLKDASAFNVQFYQGKPTFIDTLSFKQYVEGQPWVAYRQFCMHFLATLLLMKYKNVELNKLLRIYIDGIPLNIASCLLPLRSWFGLLPLIHIHLHAKTQSHFGDKRINFKTAAMNKRTLTGLIENLEEAISKINLKTPKGYWLSYYENNSYSEKSFNSKKIIFTKYIKDISPKSIWDLGANTGKFAHIIASKAKGVICFDYDHFATEANYLYCKSKNINNCLPIIIDLTNPSPSIGWANQERIPLLKRGIADTVVALALIHHLTIANNIPLEEVASFLNKICRYLIIEFVPKEDPQVQRLLNNRKDIFPNYNKQAFEKIFSKYFQINKSTPIKDSPRYMYLMKNINLK